MSPQSLTEVSDGIKLFIVSNQEEEKLSVNKSLSNDRDRQTRDSRGCGCVWSGEAGDLLRGGRGNKLIIWWFVRKESPRWGETAGTYKYIVLKIAHQEPVWERYCWIMSTARFREQLKFVQKSCSVLCLLGLCCVCLAGWAVQHVGRSDSLTICSLSDNLLSLSALYNPRQLSVLWEIFRLSWM